jgi:hypothetical protein
LTIPAGLSRTANVYVSRELPSIVRDEDAKVFDNMLGREDAGGGVVGV